MYDAGVNDRLAAVLNSGRIRRARWCTRRFYIDVACEVFSRPTGSYRMPANIHCGARRARVPACVAGEEHGLQEIRVRADAPAAITTSEEPHYVVDERADL